MENIKKLIGEIIQVDGVNKQLKVTGVRYVNDTVELKIEEVELPEINLKHKVILNIGHGNRVSNGKVIYDSGATGNGFEEHQ